MTNNIAKISSLAFLVCVTVGCAPNWSTFEFQNSADHTIWVEDVRPLDRPPPCGVLSPQNSATANMTPQLIPEELTITWWYENNDNENHDPIETTVKIENYATVSHSNPLLIDYSGDSWTARFKTIND